MVASFHGQVDKAVSVEASGFAHDMPAALCRQPKIHRAGQCGSDGRNRH